MIYISVFALLGLLTYKFERTKYKNIICAFVVLVISLLIGLRAYNIGNDTITYHHIFNISNEYDNFFAPAELEYGYVILMRFIGLFTKNPQIAILVVAFITVTPTIIIIFKHSEMPWLSVILFFLLGIMSDQMNILRQSIAMVIVFTGSKFLIDRKIIKYIIVVLIATLFHKTALFALIIIPFLYIPVNNVLVTLIMFLSVLVTALFPYLLGIIGKLFPQYAGYLDSTYFDGSGWLGSTFSLFILISTLFLLLNYTRVPLNKGLVFTFNLYSGMSKPKTYAFEWAFIILIAGGIVAIAANIVSRLTAYYTMFMLLFYPKIAKSIEFKPARNMFLFLFIALYLARFIIVQILRPEWNFILPYRFFWQVN